NGSLPPDALPPKSSRLTQFAATAILHMAQRSRRDTRVDPQRPIGGLRSGRASGVAGKRGEHPEFVNVFERLAKGKPVVEFSSGQAIYAQDDPADCVFYIVKGRVKLAVVSASGKEAVVAILEDGHFFGQASLLTGEPVRLTTAIPLVATAVARFDRQEVTQRMHADGEFADAFISYSVAHSGRIEADLVDHLLNSTEKRLARVPLLLA